MPRRQAYTAVVTNGTSGFRTCRPSAPLAPFVEFFWSCERYAPAHSRERVLPTGTTDLIFRGDTWHELRGGLVGPRSKCVTVSTGAPFAAVGVHFKPAGAYPFVRGATADLVDSAAPLADLWGPVADAISEHLASAMAPEQRFRVMEEMLLARLSESAPQLSIRWAVDVFTRSRGLLPVGAVVQRVGMSRRRFVEEFRKEVGLSPKAFCRLRRFSAALYRVASLADVDWADVAQAAGYWDQAHFNHEFREFCGLTPSEYLARRVAPTHVAEIDG